jgi:hypothetical protein
MAALQLAVEVPTAIPFWALPVGVLAGALVAALLMLLRGRMRHRAQRALLHPFPTIAGRIPVYLRGLFVPGGEFFSRAPEDPRHPSDGVTVHKWSKIPDVFGAADVQAAGTMLQLLSTHCPEAAPALLAGDPARQAWADDGIAIGPHYMTLQILDACEPRLVALRQPAAFRVLPSGEVFEGKEGLDFGLIYKGERPGTRKAFMVVTGLGDAGTVAAARFLQAHLGTLGRLMGRAPFAAIVAVDPARGPESARLRSLQPAPRWWRRLVYRKRWRALQAGPSGGRVSAAHAVRG